MPTRRVPTGGLAALAVVLASLAVVIVAGVRAPGTRVIDVTVTSAPHVGTTVVTTTTIVVPSTTAASPTRPVLEGDHVGVPTIPRTTGSTSSSTTTTTTTIGVGLVTTTTVRAIVQPTPAESDTGTFEGASDAATVRLGDVRSVSVSVPPGTRVSLTVTCGLTSRAATAMTTATVPVVAGAASCVATFDVPTGTPGPARWRLRAW